MLRDPEERLHLSLCEEILRASSGKEKIPLADIGGLNLEEMSERLRTALIFLADQRVFTIEKGEIAVKDRLRICEVLMKGGYSPETVSQFLDWKQFEQFCRRALEENGFSVVSNLRFAESGRRYEVDLVALRSPFLLFIDAKHWRPGRSSGYKEVARRQRERMNAALQGRSLLKVAKGADLSSFCKLPLIVSLADTRIQVVERTPVVPIFRFNSFLLRLDEFWDEHSAGLGESADNEAWSNL